MKKLLATRNRKKSTEQGFSIAVSTGFGLVIMIIGLTMMGRAMKDSSVAASQKIITRTDAAAQTGATRYIAFLAKYPELAKVDSDKWVDKANELNFSQSQKDEVNEYANTSEWKDVDTNGTNGQYRLEGYSKSPSGDQIGTVKIKGRVGQNGFGASATDDIQTGTSVRVDYNPVEVAKSSASSTTTIAGGTTTIAGGTSTTNGDSTTIIGGSTTITGGTTTIDGGSTAGGTTITGGTGTITGGTVTTDGNTTTITDGTTIITGGSTTTGSSTTTDTTTAITGGTTTITGGTTTTEDGVTKITGGTIATTGGTTITGDSTTTTNSTTTTTIGSGTATTTGGTTTTDGNTTVTTGGTTTTTGGTTIIAGGTTTTDNGTTITAGTTTITAGTTTITGGTATTTGNTTTITGGTTTTIGGTTTTDSGTTTTAGTTTTTGGTTTITGGTTTTSDGVITTTGGTIATTGGTTTTTSGTTTSSSSGTESALFPSIWLTKGPGAIGQYFDAEGLLENTYADSASNSLYAKIGANKTDKGPKVNRTSLRIADFLPSKSTWQSRADLNTIAITGAVSLPNATDKYSTETIDGVATNVYRYKISSFSAGKNDTVTINTVNADKTSATTSTSKTPQKVIFYVDNNIAPSGGADIVQACTNKAGVDKTAAGCDLTNFIIYGYKNSAMTTQKICTHGSHQLQGFIVAPDYLVGGNASGNGKGAFKGSVWSKEWSSGQTDDCKGSGTSNQLMLERNPLGTWSDLTNLKNASTSLSKMPSNIQIVSVAQAVPCGTGSSNGNGNSNGGKKN